MPSPSEMAWLNRRSPLTAWNLLADRVPDGFQLEERCDLPRALGIRLPADDALDIVRGRALELGRAAVGTGEVEGVDVHVRREPGCELGAPAREEVDGTGRHVR